MDQLHMHFTSAIHNTAFQIVLGYVELCSGTGKENFSKKQYTDLCKVRINLIINFSSLHYNVPVAFLNSTKSTLNLTIYAEFKKGYMCN